MTKQAKGQAPQEQVTVGHTQDRTRLWIVTGDGKDIGSVSLSPKAARLLPSALARAQRDPGRAVTIRT